jgi:uncharacterized OsmC-like protein
MPSSTPTLVNGIDVSAVEQLAAAIAADPAAGAAAFRVATKWNGGTKTESRATSYSLGGRPHARDFTMRTDEPFELAGENTEPNPQEMLMASLNACMTVGYAALCSLQGIRLESVEIVTEGQLDLRGFFGLDPSVKAGYDELRYVVTIKADGTRQQLQAIHEAVMATSPNRWNLSAPVTLVSELVIG